MRKQNYELNDNCGSRISSIFMPSTRVQSLNHVSVNVAYSMPVQHVLTSTTHPLLGALPSKGEVGSCCSMFLICKDIIILHILVFLLCHGIRICSFLESCTWHQRNQIAQGFVVVIIN